jgi:uncharacterized protein
MMSEETSRVFRPGGISYLHIPARDPRAAAAFYQAVFAWKLGGDPNRPSFEDGSGHVIGRWVDDRTPSEQAGMLPYVYVDRVDDTVAKATARGGIIVKPVYVEGDLLVSVIRDPAGNSIGVWQRREDP